MIHTKDDFDIQVIQSTNPIPTSMQLLVNREHLVVYRQTDCDKLGEFAYRFDVYPSDDGVDCDKIVSAIVRKMVSQSYDHGAQWRETRRYRIDKERMSPVSIVVQFYVRDAG